MNPKILPNYIRTQLRQGVAKDRLLETLRVGGWSAGDIEVALREVESTPDSTPAFDLGPRAHRMPMGLGRKIVLIIFLLIVLALGYLFYIGGKDYTSVTKTESELVE